MHFIGVGLRLSQAANSAEVSYAVASMTIQLMPNVIMFSSLSGHVVRGDRCLKDYGFRLSQARVDSAEVSTQWLCYLHFAFLQRFYSNWLVCWEALKCIFFSCAHLVRSKT